MSEFLNFEIKETFNGNLGDPHWPPGTDFIIGISYIDPLPNKFISPDDAYARALTADYYEYYDGWKEIGNASDFLRWLHNKTGYEISWPEPYKDHPIFNRWYNFQILPWRELIRRHLTKNCYVSDRDMIIPKKD